MITFQWNALRAGDRVLVHGEGGGPLEPGQVALVTVLKGANGIGVRLTAADGAEHVVWPSRLVVHNAAGDIDEHCDRCPAPA